MLNLRRFGTIQGSSRSSLQVVWPRRTAQDASLATEKLFDLFADHHPQMIAESDLEWTFELDWPVHLLAYTDPFLQELARGHYGLNLEDLSGYTEIRRCGRADFVFSMFHSRALLAPSLAAARSKRLPRTIIHVDAHSDLGPPLLAASGEGLLTNSEFGVSCRLDQPDEVTQVIDAGLIHKGSFLAAYILGVPGGSLFHVWEEASPGVDYLVPQISAEIIGTRKITRGVLCPNLEPQPKAWCREKLLALPQNLPPSCSGGVWLDIDLDAFCNRFDGDSDRQTLSGSTEETKTLHQRVAAFLQQFRAVSWLREIEAVSVAASPGFFPAEHWETTIPTICDELAAVLESS